MSADFYYREAQRLGYVGRLAFKLLQLQKQFKLIGAGDSVLDLGCAPGAWLQVACQSLGPLERSGAVVGIDIKNVKVPSHHCDSSVRTVCADVMKLLKSQTRELSPQGKGFSVMLSDMCPIVTGITTRDSALSCELGKRALSLAIGRGKIPGSGDKNDSKDFFDSSELDVIEDGAYGEGVTLLLSFLRVKTIKNLAISASHVFRK